MRFYPSPKFCKYFFYKRSPLYSETGFAIMDVFFMIVSSIIVKDKNNDCLY